MNFWVEAAETRRIPDKTQIRVHRKFTPLPGLPRLFAALKGKKKAAEPELSRLVFE